MVNEGAAEENDSRIRAQCVLCYTGTYGPIHTTIDNRILFILPTAAHSVTVHCTTTVNSTVPWIINGTISIVVLHVVHVYELGYSNC